MNTVQNFVELFRFSINHQSQKRCESSDLRKVHNLSEVVNIHQRSIKSSTKE